MILSRRNHKKFIAQNSIRTSFLYFYFLTYKQGKNDIQRILCVTDVLSNIKNERIEVTKGTKENSMMNND